MSSLQSTNYYLVRDGELTNLASLIDSAIADNVFSELEEIAEPRPGDEDYAHVYGRRIGKGEVSFFGEPRLEDALSNYAEDTGKSYIDLFQWNTPDSTLYFLLKGKCFTEIEDVLGPMPSKEMQGILMELDEFFAPLEDAGAPGYVRLMRFNRDDLHEDEGHSEDLRDLLEKEIPDGDDASIFIYQWTE